eukprot:scaffold5483_cov127-Isochrysis_galbana.AAC.7
MDTVGGGAGPTRWVPETFSRRLSAAGAAAPPTDFSRKEGCSHRPRSRLVHRQLPPRLPGAWPGLTGPHRTPTQDVMC